MKKIITVLALSGFMVAGCSTDPNTGQTRVNKTAAGAVLGAGAGALAGLAVGGSRVAQRNAVLIGAGVGALAGGGIGAYMDKQERELRSGLQGTGVSVTRQGNNIVLNMPSNITFATDQDQVQSGFYATLNAVAKVLEQYNQTLVDVYGHTDSTGDASYNLALSQRRATSVANYLTQKGVDSRRFYVTGLGETQPIASNATPEGRAQNRRVEIKLSPITNNNG